ncbi:MAG: outer membrane protein assembly factor BamD, partial [candidate division Zixibacteria bacterium]|nr:outer membrane protein assembly factor BamD [candidate division Zixibacteria bacterium]
LIGLLMISGCTSNKAMLASTADEQFQLAKREYDKGKYFNSIDAFQRVIFNFPGANIVDTAQYYLSHSYYGNKEFELAAVEFNRLLVNYPHSAFTDDAQYMVGVCYMKNSPKHHALDQEDLKRAIVALEDFILDNPDSPLKVDAKASILEARTKLAYKEYANGMTYFKMYSYKASRVYFQKVIDEYTDTDFAPKALFKIGESFYKQEKYDESKTKFDSFISIYPSNELVEKTQEYLKKMSDKLNPENAAG